MSDAVIQATGLTRYFGRQCAVDQVSFAVPRGSVFALLGRNGSGKSTIIRMLLGLLEPTRGSATVLGQDCQKISDSVRGRIGYVAEGHPLFDGMRIDELARFQRSFYPNWDAGLFDRVIKHFDLSGHQRAGKVSRGQRAGISLALVLATKPELLVMDDPALGLDPLARRSLLEAMILLTRDAGNTIFFTSHQLDDVERVTDFIAILDRSILRVCCPVEMLQNRVKRFSLEFPTPPPVPTNRIEGLLESHREGNSLNLTIANANGHTQEAIAAMGATRVVESEIKLADIVVGYLRGGVEKKSLLEALAGATS